eukprot:NODE_526_length_7226_cov_0.465273.p1 type:complete len:600 gc:universal NODE_526_length_7226_cov_0.465273:5284-7083(+)
MELFNEMVLNINGTEIISSKLVGYTMGVPYLMEPLNIAKLIKNENVIYKVHKEVQVLIEMNEMIHDFIETNNSVYFITRKGLYRYENGIEIIATGNMTEFRGELVHCEDGNVYDLGGNIIDNVEMVSVVAKVESSDDIAKSILNDFGSLHDDIKAGIQKILFAEYHKKEWIDIEQFYPTNSQLIELTQMKYDPNKASLLLLDIQSTRIGSKKIKRLEAIKEMEDLKALKPRRDYIETSTPRDQMGVLNHIERYTSSKLLYYEIHQILESPKNSLMMSLLSMDIEHFHTFATLNQCPLREYVLIDHEVKSLAVQLEESREDLKRVKAEFKKKTIENQDYLDLQKAKYNQIKLVYSDRVKYKEQVLYDLNCVYEKYMNDIPQWTMSLVGYSNEIVNTDAVVHGKRFYLLSQKAYREMCDLLQNQKTKHENTRSQKFNLQREYNVKQSNKKFVETEVVKLKNQIANELFNKFARPVTLEEAENLILQHKEVPFETLPSVDPRLMQLDKEIESLQHEAELMMIEESKINLEIYELNKLYINGLAPSVEPRSAVTLDQSIQEHLKINSELKRENQELTDDIIDLRKYPSKSTHYTHKWQNEDDE